MSKITTITYAGCEWPAGRQAKSDHVRYDSLPSSLAGVRDNVHLLKRSNLVVFGPDVGLHCPSDHADTMDGIWPMRGRAFYGYPDVGPVYRAYGQGLVPIEEELRNLDVFPFTVEEASASVLTQK